ncbi:hypothetical protein B0H14DRAFT_3435748 [Mycena olivaceomarginata]|nr:hypothetical protein B0H14DRAFT_3435748 [Mycena olivaceomarginata]
MRLTSLPSVHQVPTRRPHFSKAEAIDTSFQASDTSRTINHHNMDSNVGRVANQAPAFNPRVPSSNTNPRASAYAPQCASSYQALVAQLGAMALKQDEMQAQLHAQNELRTQNEYLRQRMHELERIVAQGGSATPSSFSERLDGRGRAVSRNISVPSTPPEVSEPSDDETTPVAANPDVGPQETVDLIIPSKDLPTRELQRARDVLQAEVSRVWREVVGVLGTVWPDLTVQCFNDVTHEAYLNPAFDGTVLHSDNQHLFTEVAKQVSHQLQRGPKTWPPGLAVPNVNVTWTSKTLIEMSKTTFRSCKVQWRQQVDSEVAKKVAEHNSKANQRDKAIPIVAAKYGIEPKIAKDALLHEQHMSDEYSGPEDRDETSQAVWKTKMAFKAGYDNVPESVLAKTEVAETPWRSEKMSKLLHELSVTVFGLLSSSNKKKIRLVRVRDTGRAPSDIPAYGGLLDDWGTQADPEGFGGSEAGENETEQVQINADINDNEQE